MLISQWAILHTTTLLCSILHSDLVVLLFYISRSHHIMIVIWECKIWTSAMIKIMMRDKLTVDGWMEGRVDMLWLYTWVFRLGLRLRLGIKEEAKIYQFPAEYPTCLDAPRSVAVGQQKEPVCQVPGDQHTSQTIHSLIWEQRKDSPTKMINSESSLWSDWEQ